MVCGVVALFAGTLLLISDVPDGIPIGGFRGVWVPPVLGVALTVLGYAQRKRAATGD